MTREVKNRGASGHDSILFRQDLEYPRAPGQITYYPPEPSEELQKQVRMDKAGGIALYIIGFATAIIGLLGAMEFSRTITIYATLIPFLLVLGLLFAILYLVMDNVSMATLSRALPAILMVALVLLYILSIFMAVMDMASVIESGNEDAVSDAMDNIFGSLLNPAFFFMAAGLLICRAGGTMLWTSTKVVHQYIPGMIIIETEDHTGSVGQTEERPDQEDYVDNEPDPQHPCKECSEPMTFIPQYGRYYCYECGTYGDKEE